MINDFIRLLRQSVKWQMRVDRGGAYALCDICHEHLGTDMHEIISRARTMGNEEAQLASFDKHICALLCNDCHVNKNLAEECEQFLLGVLIHMYGREEVLSAIQRVQDVSTTTLFLDIPEGL